MPCSRFSFSALFSLLLTTSPVPAQEELRARGGPVREVASLDDAKLRTAARSSNVGDRLRVRSVPLFDGPTETLELERFAVFKPDARIQVRTAAGIEVLEPPKGRLFRGQIAGSDASMAYLAVQDDGRVQGLVAEEDRLFLISSDSESATVSIGQLEDMDSAAREVPFACGNEEHGARLDVSDIVPGLLPSNRSGLVTKRSSSSSSYAVDVAIETDHEFYELFGSASAALDYINLLFGAVAAIYERDIDTQLRISYTVLYSTPNDPWGTSWGNYLSELQSYWNRNNQHVERTLVHQLRGRNDGFGVAYVGVLCSSFNHYGLTTSIAGNYAPAQTVPVWDLVTVAHEIGHNLSSRHTHCYNPPVDECSNAGGNCYAGPTSVPGDGGTIMSYCHSQPGGMSNINTWFGRAGFYGNQSERVNEQMIGHLAAADANGCLPDVQVTSLIFADDFESGSSSNWGG